MAGLDEDSIDLTVTSPPYDLLRLYDGFTFDLPGIVDQLYRVTRIGGAVAWIVCDASKNGAETGTSFAQVMEFQRQGWRLHDTMIYQKSGVSRPGNVRYHQAFEFMFVFSKGTKPKFRPLQDRANKTAGLKRNTKSMTKRDAAGNLTPRRVNHKTYITNPHGIRTNIWTYSTGPKQTAPDDLWQQHPAVMPLDLAADHILSWGDPGDTVLDPLAGSGQVPIAADILGREWIAIDCSPRYCYLIEQRLEWFRRRSGVQQKSPCIEGLVGCLAG
jgi:site-specific DNA-methyltransferase (adenine-specific)